MAARPLKSDVHGLLSHALGRSISESENPSRETEPGWDSFTHVEIVCQLEDHFKVRFEGREIARLQDARDIVHLLETRLAS
jgi:acyl carrier protein